MHSLINIVTRRNTSGNPYYQVRFYDKEGRLLKTKSYPDTPSRTKVYQEARQELEKGTIIPSLSGEEALTYSQLTLPEVKMIYRNPNTRISNFLRSRLVVLLGTSCGLGVGEITRLRFEHIDFEKKELTTGIKDAKRIIPLNNMVRGLIIDIRKIYPNSPYVIPNLRNMEKPCDPIAITRSLEVILEYFKITKERHITPSSFQYTFINILSKYKAPVNAIDYLCGFKHETDNETTLKKGIEHVIQAINLFFLEA